MPSLLRALALLLLCQTICSTALAKDDVTPPSTLPAWAQLELKLGYGTPRTCQNPPQIAGYSATTPLPGAWRSGLRYGVGWDFVYNSELDALSAYWYTFDDQNRPVWYQTELSQINRTAQRWSGVLLESTLAPGASSRSAPTPVGAVSLQLLPDRTRAVVRWQLLSNHAVPVEECLVDEFGPGLPVQSANPHNRTHVWKASGIQNFDVVTSPIGSNPTGRQTILSFTATGLPAWMVAMPPSAQTSSPTTTHYFQGNYPQTVRKTCAAASCASPQAGGSAQSALANSTPAYRLDLASAGGNGLDSVSYNWPSTALGSVTQATNNSPSYWLSIRSPNPCYLTNGSSLCSVEGTFRSMDRLVLRNRLNPDTMNWIGTSAGSGLQLWTDIVSHGDYRYYLSNSSTSISHLRPIAPLKVIGYVPPPPDFAPADPNICRSGGSTTTPGALPGRSGRWENPSLPGPAWDLHFSQGTLPGNGGNAASLSVAWFTFDAAGQPTWLLASNGQMHWMQGSNNNPGYWYTVGNLVRYSWNFVTNEIAAAVAEGQVAVSFVHDQPHRAAVRWNWSQVPSTQQSSNPQPITECLGEVSFGGSMPTGSVNYPGRWIERSYDGYPAYGEHHFYSIFLRNQAGALSEGAAIAMFGNPGANQAGTARWVLANGIAPSSDSRTASLTYQTSTHGVPRAGHCPTGNCIQSSPAGTFTRSFAVDGLTGDTQVTAQLPGQGTWQRPPPGFVNAPIQKLGRTDDISVNRQTCDLGGGPCVFAISWTSLDASARAWRRNLANQDPAMLVQPAQQSGSATHEYLVAGRFRYELRAGDNALGNLLASTDIEVTGTLPATSFQLSANPNPCSGAVGSTCNINLGWSRSAASGMVGVFRSPAGSSTFQLVGAPIPSGASPASGTITDPVVVTASSQSYQYQLYNCSAPCQSPSGSPLATAPTVTVAPTGGGGPGPIGVAPDKQPVANNDLPPHDPTVGVWEGQAGVSGGAASYSVPIAVPPGRAGVEPALAISYSSRAGNGLFGVGFSLEGLSSITRCPSTIAQDGSMRAVRLDDADQLCWDGSRLMPSSDFCPGGGVAYRTEIDSFARICRSGPLTGNNTSFTISTKDGWTLHYGSTPDGRQARNTVSVDGITHTFSWPVLRRQDSRGHAIDYQYTSHGTNVGQLLIDRVDYTLFRGSISEGPTRYVRFIYEDRPAADVTTTWIANAEIVSTKRIAHIETYVGGLAAAERRDRYSFSYAPSLSSDRTLLRSMTRCTKPLGAVAPNLCLPATEFAWQEASRSTMLKVDRYQGIEEFVAGLTDGAIRSRELVTAGDVDGDGTREMLLLLYNEQSPTADAYLVFPNADRQATTAAPGIRRIFDLVRNGVAGAPLSYSFVNLAEWADFNMDGKSDVLAWELSPNPPHLPTQLVVLNWNNATQKFAPTTALADPSIAGAQSSDLNGDGYADLVYQAPNALGCSGAAGVVWRRNNWQGGLSFNFDAPATLKCLVSSHIHAGQASASGSGATGFTNMPARFAGVRDLNGDGIPELSIELERNVPTFGVPAVGDKRWVSGYFLGVRNAVGHYEAGGQSNSLVTFVRGMMSGAPRSDEDSATTDAAISFLWNDINGDGLQDYVYRAPNCYGLYVRLNRGGDQLGNLLSERIKIGNQGSIGWNSNDMPATSCPAAYTIQPGSGTENKAMALSTGDIDSDGREELLLPARFAQRVCVLGRYRTGSGNDTAFGPAYFCPEDPSGTYPSVGGQLAGLPVYALYGRTPSAGGFVAPISPAPPGRGASCGVPAPGQAQLGDPYAVRCADGNDLCGLGRDDESTYFLDALRLIPSTDANGRVVGWSIAREATNAVGKNGRFGIGDRSDHFGDGLNDTVVSTGWPFRRSELSVQTSAGTQCFSKARAGVHFDNGAVLGPAQVPSSLVPNTDASCPTNGVMPQVGCEPTRNLLISENIGAGARAGTTPKIVDVLSQVTEGVNKLNRSYRWEYQPLSASQRLPGGCNENGAQCSAIYSNPRRDDNMASLDADHFYFTSSMSVVTQFFTPEPNALGAQRLTTYGYSEAIYNNKGRGFQGFRMVDTHQHVQGPGSPGLRTRQVYFQTFPIAGLLGNEVVSLLSQTVGSAVPLSVRNNRWGCDRNDLSLTTIGFMRFTGCFLQPGQRIYWPFLSESTLGENDLELARLGQFRLLREEIVRNRAPNATTAGYDIHGNLVAQHTIVRDVDPTNSSLPATASYQTTVSNVFNPNPDLSAWWLDRLDSSTTTRQVLARHPSWTLPPGVDQAQSTTKAFAWNSDRTLQSETLSSNGVTEATSTYAYHPTYRLPTSVTQTARQAQSRVTTTGYTSDFYFPRTVTQSPGNGTSHVVTTEVRPADGQPVSITDAKNLVTTKVLDMFGFATQVQAPVVGSLRASQHARAVKGWCGGGTGLEVSNCPAGAVYFVAQAMDTGGTSAEYFDVLGRKLGTKRSNPVPNGSFQPWIIDRQEYNARGLVSRSVGSSFLGEGASAGSVSFFDYDELGRPGVKLSNQAPAGAGAIQTPGYTHIAYRYEGLTTRITVRGRNTPAVLSAADRHSCANLSGLDAQLRPDGTLLNHPCFQVSRQVDGRGAFVSTRDAANLETRFWHDGSGNALMIRDVANVDTRATYDAFNRRTQSIDPNQGTWTFTYNGYGELTSSVDARGASVSREYDGVGRLKQVNYPVMGTEPAYSEFYDYDLATSTCSETWSMATPLGELVRKRTERSGQLRFDERYCHDPLGRVRDVHTGIAPDGGGALTQYRTQTFYDTQHGWPKQIIYPGERVSVRWVRNDRGAPVEVRNMAGDGLLRRLTAMDQHGGEAGVELGNNWHLATELDPATGVMTRQTTRLGGSVIDQWDYRYDAFGNLTRQTRVGGTNGEESFYYDLQQRMVGRRTGTGPAYTVSYAYTATGNIDFKSDYSRTEAGAYTYHATRPNAVERVKRPSGLADDVYGYDANGNLVSGNQISASYDGANRAARLSRSGAQQHFEYAPGGARFRQVNVAKGEETRYVGGIEEVRSQISGTLLYVRHSVAANVWITVDCPAGNCGAASVRYAVQDRLGSTVLFGTSTGAVTDRKTYDPYGKPREGNFSESITSPFANIFSTAASGGLLGRDTVRGFTAHEHLDEVRLIHMNGRVFDYTLGRFHAVDPIIQFPSNSQSLNPYSYILNNPMAGTDPTGYAACTGSRIDRETVSNDGDCEGLNVAQISATETGTSEKGESKNFGNGRASSSSFSFNTKSAQEDTGAPTTMPPVDVFGQRPPEPSTYVRAAGFIRMLGGSLTAFFAGAAGSSPTPCLVWCLGFAALGADQAAAGALEFSTGIPHRSFVNQAAVALTGSETAGMGADLLAGLSPAAPATAGAVAIRLESGVAAKSVSVASGIDASGTLQFRHGELFERTFNTRSGPVDFIAETVVKGDTLILKDVAVFGRKGNEALKGLQREVFRGVAELKQLAKEQGFKRLEITGTRVPTSSSARPGHGVDLGWDL